MNETRRSFLAQASAAAGALALAPARGFSAGPGAVFTPEMFGAKGDGVANDSVAMAALALAVNANGGGTIAFRRTTYKIGAQLAAQETGAPYAFEPAPLLDFRNCRLPLIILGNGATLRCASGLRYGTFDPEGRPLRHAMPYLGPGLATPYREMIAGRRCLAPIELSDLELDGNVAGLIIGGGYGDVGRQIPANGLALIDNMAGETIRNLYTHHHALDGLYIDGLAGPTVRKPVRRIADVRSEYNGRQGCSIVGGRGYSFDRCKFNHTGRAGLTSAPGAGVDIEAEGGKTNRDLRFSHCEFSNNAGCGMVADSGDSEGAVFTNCSFVGTSEWSVWPAKPFFAFRGCTFAGAIAQVHGDNDPDRAAKFFDCTFTDDPQVSPVGKLYGGTNRDRPLADLSDAQNMLFQRCRFLATHNAVLPWSVHAIYADCVMTQRSSTISFPRGTYVGRSRIDGSANLTGSRISGELILNGNRHAATVL